MIYKADAASLRNEVGTAFDNMYQRLADISSTLSRIVSGDINITTMVRLNGVDFHKIIPDQYNKHKSLEYLSSVLTILTNVLNQDKTIRNKYLNTACGCDILPARDNMGLAIVIQFKSIFAAHDFTKFINETNWTKAPQKAMMPGTPKATAALNWTPNFSAEGNSHTTLSNKPSTLLNSPPSGI